MNQKITPFLWFKDKAEEAAKFYVDVFKEAGFDAKIKNVDKYMEEVAKISNKDTGSVMVVEFELAGMEFAALNGGPVPGFEFSPATSFVINCQTQQEVDTLWEKLSADPAAEQCGWLRDKFGVTWQVVPIVLNELLRDPDPKKAENVMKVMLQMKKLDIEKLKQAAEIESR